MRHIIISSAGVTGKIITTPLKIVEIANDSFTFHYMPGAQIDYTKIPDIFVEEKACNKPVILKYPQIIIPQTNDHRGLVSACDYLLERARQEKLGVYSLNSSSVQKENQAIVFFGGATNLGKTSSALELTANGFEFFSDEKTLLNLNEQILYGGSKSIALRKEVLQQKVGSQKEFQRINKSSYLRPHISMMVLPHLDHGLKDSICYKLNQIDAFWQLNKELTRRIRGDTKFIGNFKYPLQSIDNEELSLKRVNAIKRLTKTIPIYYFQGDLDQLSKFVKKEFNK